MDLPCVIKSEVQGLRKRRVLGSGGFGTVYKVTYKDRKACMKEGNNQQLFKNFKREVMLLKILNGAGGAPGLLAISEDQPT